MDDPSRTAQVATTGVVPSHFNAPRWQPGVLTNVQIFKATHVERELSCESTFWRLQRPFHLFFLMLLRAQTHNKMMKRMGTARSVATTAAAMDLEGIANGKIAEAIMGLIGESGRAAIMDLVGESGRAAVMDLVGVASTGPEARMMITPRTVAASVECVGSLE